MAVSIAPVWVLCWLVGSLVATGVELLRPRGVTYLLQDAIAGTFGAICGQFLASQLGGLTLLAGDLHVPEVVVGAVLTTLIARRLSA